MNTYLKYQPPGVQFVAFLGMAMGFMVINALLTYYLFDDLSAILLNKEVAISSEIIVQFKIAQVISAVLSFLVPALLFGYFSSPASLPYIGIQKSISFPLVLMSIVLLVIVQPFVGWVGDLNSKIDFGSFQQSMQQAEAAYNRALQTFLKMENTGDLVINLFLMALLPAIAEELFFRGAFQKVLLRLMNVPVIAIVVSSGVFAILHGTVFKFLPIFALGLMLGTIYHVTRNLWYTIIIHFFNNALAVLAVYYSSRNDMWKKLANDDINISWYAAALSLVVTVAVIYFMHRKSEQVLPAAVTNEHNDYIA